VRSRVEGSSVVLRITTFNDQTYPNLSDGIAKQVEELGGIDNVNGFVLDLWLALASDPRVRRVFREGRNRLNPRPRSAGRRSL